MLNINEQHVVRLASAMAPPTEDIGRWEETVAIHEAGHAVTAMALPHISVSYINILRETTAVNYGNSKQELGDAIISLLAGGEAVKMSKRTRHMTTGDGQDLHLAEIYARTLLIVEGHNQSAPDFERSVRRMLATAKMKAWEILMQHWPAVEAIAEVTRILPILDQRKLHHLFEEHRQQKLEGISADCSV